eukprot:gb/GEZN01006907.1/.p1 GENE.gb/GEZN01006907.1/~~gb/GEZN01006907.1/.p1  ORF type:complete len:215 (-),score=20.56 gb/GEZN01006907.1/:854-1498(-)
MELRRRFVLQVCLLLMPFAWGLIVSGTNKPEFLSANPAHYNHVTGAFGPIDYSVTARLVVAIPTDACGPLIGTNLRGNIVLTTRGGCMFWKKASNAQKAGAVGLVVGNNERQEPQLFQMAFDPDANEEPTVISIPSVMVSKVHHLTLFRDASSSKHWVNVTLEPDEIYDVPYMMEDELQDLETELVEQLFAEVAREARFRPNETDLLVGSLLMT